MNKKRFNEPLKGILVGATASQDLTLDSSFQPAAGACPAGLDQERR